MGHEINIFSTNLGDADGVIAQYTLVQLDGSGAVTTSGAGEAGYPLTEPTTAAGEDSTVQILGVVRAIAGAALATDGIALASDASGRVVAAIAGDVIVGYLLSTAGGAGEIVSMILPGGQGATFAVS